MCHAGVELPRDRTGASCEIRRFEPVGAGTQRAPTAAEKENAMARGYPPAYGRSQTGTQRRVMSVAELEQMYGRNAQVELRSPPVYQQDTAYQAGNNYQPDWSK